MLSSICTVLKKVNLSNRVSNFLMELSTDVLPFCTVCDCCHLLSKEMFLKVSAIKNRGSAANFNAFPFTYQKMQLIVQRNNISQWSISELHHQKLDFVCCFTSQQYLRLYQDGYRLVTAHSWLLYSAAPLGNQATSTMT